ncbi:hypothetical protein METBIDRAFT_190743 [Metschnikowia bicuspidata var. bicuspidata NRRL YB-4993]|uniref:Kinetochore protein Sos7 coiled-coil domain-containing protein n=1 Tax=Metschnikowia bicuspidata var. bicuspidata NRRL YB-4993 TaxID=869754 RepID=A0A1A0HC31_9ASCO|nr:hypothetical protein METBIDRAFT_190743 [Metschnikowia bicuspidata var. bicuspidata NRRL YB-4993]OBA21694.1 hypothetical protein METBIDRAFT_190743 [Metschnikowia bicuspidata var. bicuspidata NRRL YB-4993]
MSRGSPTVRRQPQTTMNEEKGMFSVELAEDTYRAKVATSALKPSDPSLIKGDIASLKRFCSKLKFQYLEQDTRDKFVAVLFSEHAESVSQKNVDAVAGENTSAKAELKQLKKELAERVALSESVAEDVISINQRLQTRRKEAESASAELAALEKEFHALVSLPENESYKMLFDLNKMIDSQDVRPDEAIRIAETDLKQDQVMFHDLQQQEQALLEKAAQMNRHTEELQNTLLRMKTELEHSSRTPNGHPEPEQVRAQWLRELNSVLHKFTVAPVEIRQIGANYVLLCGRDEIVFSSDLNIVLVLNHVLRSLDVNQVNHVSGERKVEYLLRVIMKAFAG